MNVDHDVFTPVKEVLDVRKLRYCRCCGNATFNSTGPHHGEQCVFACLNLGVGPATSTTLLYDHYQCVVKTCPFTATDDYDLRQHLNLHNIVVEPDECTIDVHNFECCYCDYKTTQRRYLERHELACSLGVHSSTTRSESSHSKSPQNDYILIDDQETSKENSPTAKCLNGYNYNELVTQCQKQSTKKKLQIPALKPMSLFSTEDSKLPSIFDGNVPDVPIKDNSWEMPNIANSSALSVSCTTELELSVGGSFTEITTTPVLFAEKGTTVKPNSNIDPFLGPWIDINCTSTQLPALQPTNTQPTTELDCAVSVEDVTELGKEPPTSGITDVCEEDTAEIYKAVLAARSISRAAQSISRAAQSVIDQATKTLNKVQPNHPDQESDAESLWRSMETESEEEGESHSARVFLQLDQVQQACSDTVGVAFACENCHYVIANREQPNFKQLAESHKIRCGSPRFEDYRCQKCDYVAVGKEHLRRHAVVIHKIRSSNTSCFTKQTIRERCKDIRSKRLSKPPTKTSPRKNPSTEVHIFIYKCEKCPFQVDNKRKFDAHVSRCDVARYEQFRCIECYFIAEDRNYMYQHHSAEHTPKRKKRKLRDRHQSRQSSVGTIVLEHGNEANTGNYGNAGEKDTQADLSLSERMKSNCKSKRLRMYPLRSNLGTTGSDLGKIKFTSKNVQTAHKASHSATSHNDKISNTDNVSPPRPSSSNDSSKVSTESQDEITIPPKGMLEKALMSSNELSPRTLPVPSLVQEIDHTVVNVQNSAREGIPSDVRTDHIPGPFPANIILVPTSGTSSDAQMQNYPQFYCRFAGCNFVTSNANSLRIHGLVDNCQGHMFRKRPATQQNNAHVCPYSYCFFKGSYFSTKVHMSRCGKAEFDAFACPEQGCFFIGASKAGLKIHSNKHSVKSSTPQPIFCGRDVRSHKNIYKCPFPYCYYKSSSHTMIFVHSQRCGKEEFEKFACPERDCFFIGSSSASMYNHRSMNHRMPLELTQCLRNVVL